MSACRRFRAPSQAEHPVWFAIPVSRCFPRDFRRFVGQEWESPLFVTISIAIMPSTLSSPERGFPQAVEGTAPRTFGGSLVANNPFSAPVRTGQTNRILLHRRFILVLQDKIEEILLINVLRAIWLRTGNVDLTGLLAYSQRDQGISKKIPLARTFQKSGGFVVYVTVPYRNVQFAG